MKQNSFQRFLTSDIYQEVIESLKGWTGNATHRAHRSRQVSHVSIGDDYDLSGPLSFSGDRETKAVGAAGAAVGGGGGVGGGVASSELRRPSRVAPSRAGGQGSVLASLKT